MNNNFPSTHGTSRSTLRPKKQFVAKGHDAILKELQDSGATISVALLGDGSEIIGKLVARDKFTLTVLTAAGSRRTIYKHAIESFGPATVQ